MAAQVKVADAQAAMLETLWCRVLDLRNDRSILSDQHAADVAERIDFDFDNLDIEPMMIAVTCARGLWIDQKATKFLTDNPDAVVLHVGSGLDTRYDRLRPSRQVSWFEVDYPDIADIRQQLLPPTASAQIVGADVVDLRWLDSVPLGRPTLIIAEGLSMFLEPSAGQALLAALTHRYHGELIMDINGSSGAVGQWMNANVRRSTTPWRWLIDDPADLEPLGLDLVCDRAIADLILDLPMGTVSPALGLGLALSSLVPMMPRGGIVACYRMSGPH